MPVGMISGGEDWVTPVKFSREYFDYVQAPRKRFALVAGCGHSPQGDEPEEFAALVKEMLGAFTEN